MTSGHDGKPLAGQRALVFLKPLNDCANGFNHFMLRSKLAAYGTILCLFLPFGFAKAESGRIIYSPPADRAFAAEWLGKLKADSSVPLLIDLCADPDGGVRAAAVTALGQIGGLRAFDTLKTLASDPAQEGVEGGITFNSDRWSWDTAFGKQPSRVPYDVRRTALQTLLQLTADHPDLPPFEPTEVLDELHRTLTDVSKDLAEYERRGSEDSTDPTYPAYQASKRFQEANRQYFRCYEAIETITLAKQSAWSAHALLGVFGCGLEDFEMMASRALVLHDSTPMILESVKGILSRKDLSPLSLAACLNVVAKLEPSSAQPLARRLLARMSTADEHAWKRFPAFAGDVLLQTLKAEDVPLVHALHDVQIDLLRRMALEELARCLSGELPSTDKLLYLKDVTTLPPEQRKDATGIYVRELNDPKRGSHSYMAAYQLGRLRVPEAIPGLLHLIEYPTVGIFGPDYGIASYYQSMAGWALTQIADPACVPKLREIAIRQSHDVDSVGEPPTGALLAYSRLAGERAIDDLALVLTQEGGSRYAAVASNLGVADGPRFMKIAFGSTPLAFPDFDVRQDAAAFALAEIGGPRARDVLVKYLAGVGGKRKLTGEIVEAIFRLAPTQLDEWSRTTLASGIPWERGDLRETAAAVRIYYFPQTSAGLIHSILQDPTHPLRLRVIWVLRYLSAKDDTVTADLVRLLDQPQLAKERDGDSEFDHRLQLIDAIGRQGGPVAAAALLRVAGGNLAAAKPSP